MDLNKIYEELSLNEDIKNFDELVKIRTGFFRENDLIKVFSGNSELYFKIDKQGILELMDSLIKKIYQLPSKDSFNHMLDIFLLLQNEINDFFGNYNYGNRLSFYLINGEKTEDEDVRICSLSQIKGKGIAECAEKTSVANNILLMLNYMGLFDYKVNYLNSLLFLNNQNPGGHAFLEFSKVNKNGNVIHIIYDITNPENLLRNGKEFTYLALYSLTEEEFELFKSGGSFDNSKFLLSNYYEVKEKRTYSSFQNALHKKAK